MTLPSKKLTNLVNVNKIRAALKESLAATMPHVDKKIKETFHDPIWQWPRQTRRRNGTLVTSPRDVIDRGSLLDSQSYRQTKANEYTFTWKADYAQNVFAGDDGATYARNVPIVALYHFNLAQKFSVEFKALLSKANP